MTTRRPKPPPSLDALRAQLDQAAVARVLLPLRQPVQRPDDLAAALHVAPATVAVPLLVDADGDRLTAIIPGDRRLDLRKLAAAVGARQARLHGTGASRRHVHAEEPRLLSGLPTVLDRSLAMLDHVFSFTGDPLWAIRIGPGELRRATAAQLADIARPGHVPLARPAPAAIGSGRVGEGDTTDGDDIGEGDAEASGR